jgi:hypothetical protein
LLCRWVWLLTLINETAHCPETLLTTPQPALSKLWEPTCGAGGEACSQQLSTVTKIGFCCRISIYTVKSACVSSLRLVKRWKLRNQGSNPGRGRHVCLLQLVQNGFGSTQHSVNWVKPFGRVADHSCPSGTEDNSSWSLPTVLPTP